jgi:hypothetical protein
MVGVLIIFMSVGGQADNVVKHFEKGKSELGGIIDNEVIFIYFDKKSVNTKNKSDLKILKFIAQKKICEKKDTREIVEDLGMSVKFIYLHKGNATIVKIDSCKGVTTNNKTKGEV